MIMILLYHAKHNFWTHYEYIWINVNKPEIHVGIYRPCRPRRELSVIETPSRGQHGSVHPKNHTIGESWCPGDVGIPGKSSLVRQQGSWGQHGARMGPVGPSWAPCWPHEPCYQCSYPMMCVSAVAAALMESWLLQTGQHGISIVSDHNNEEAKVVRFIILLGTM